MALCGLCSLEMTSTVSCVETPIMTDTGFYPPIPYGKERSRRRSPRCGDCDTPKGGFHHRGCDIEACPRCRGQLISCRCDRSESDPDEYDDLDEYDVDEDEIGTCW